MWVIHKYYFVSDTQNKLGWRETLESIGTRAWSVYESFARDGPNENTKGEKTMKNILSKKKIKSLKVCQSTWQTQEKSDKYC